MQATSRVTTTETRELKITTFTTEDRIAATDIVQGSAAWHQLRLGKVTASRLSDVMAKGKTGEAATRADYKLDLVIERLTGKPTDSFTNAAMAWGTEQEPFARAAYELEKGLFVKEIAFVDHPTILGFGASPDGLVNDDGCLEIKNPNSKTHLKYLKDNKPPAKYLNQMIGQLSCTQRDFVDFCSYDSRFPSGLQLFIVRYYRDEKAIAEIETEVKKFLEEVEEELALLKQKMGVK